MMRRGWLLLAVLCLASTAFADGEWLWTNPADGAQLNARGPGINVDAFGRAYENAPSNAWVFEPLRPNAYGLGVDSDTLGRAVTPSWDVPGTETGGDE
jgi:hypothetical protein